MDIPSCTSSHSGKPRADKRVKPYGHGWFMLGHPKYLRTLLARAMEAREGKDILEMPCVRPCPYIPRCRRGPCLWLPSLCLWHRGLQASETQEHRHRPVSRAWAHQRLSVQPSLTRHIAAHYFCKLRNQAVDAKDTSILSQAIQDVDCIRDAKRVTIVVPRKVSQRSRQLARS